MATKNIVPRITNEGKLGKPDKRWAQGNFSTGSFGLISGSLIPDAQESHNLGEAARPWKEIFVSTSSIKFVNPADNSVLQSLAATDSGFDFGGAIISGSTLSGSALHVTGNAFIGGNLTLGDANTDSIEITADLTSDLIPNASDSFNLGSETQRWNDLFLSGSLSASGGPVDIDSATTVAIDSTTTTTITAATTLSAKGNGGASFGDDVGTWEFDGDGAVSETGITTISMTPSSTIDIDAGGAITIDGTALTIGGDSDTGAIAVDSTAGISLDGAAASNFTTTAGALTLKADEGVNIVGNITASADISGSVTSSIVVGGSVTASAARFNSVNSDGTLTIDGTAGVTIQEGGTDVIAIDTNKDVLFSQTGGTTSDPDVEIDGYLVVDGTAEFNGTVDIDGTIDIDNDTINIDTSGAATIDFGAASSIVTAAGNLSLEAEANDSKVSIKGDHESGTSIHLDGNAAAGSIIDIDAGALDIDSTAATTIDAGTSVTITSTTDTIIDAATHANVSGAVTQVSGSTTLELFSPTEVILHSDTDTYVSGSHTAISGSTVNVKSAGAMDIDADGALTIDGSSITIGGDTDVAFDIDTTTLDVDSSDAVTIDTTAGISIDAAGASNLTTTAGTLTIQADAATASGVNILGDVTASADISGSVTSNITVGGDVTAGGGTLGNIRVGVTGDDELDSDGTLTIDGATGVTIQEGGTDVIAIDTNQDVLFSRTGGSSGDPDVEIDGYLVVDGTAEFNGTVDIDGTVDVDNDTFSVDSSGAISLDAGAASNLTTTAGAITLQANGAATSGINILGDVTASADISGSVTSNVTIGGTLQASQVGTDSNPVTAFISDGEIDGTVIGGESAEAATFTNVNATTLTTTGDIRAEGNVVAENFIVSSSVTYMTSSFSSGSTIFGDDLSDTHVFTGSVEITGSFLVNPHGPNKITGSKLTIDADGGFSGSSDSIGSFGSINVAADSLKIGVDAVREISSDGEIILDGATGLKIQEAGTDVIAIDTNQDTLFSRTGGSTSDPDVEFDGYVRFDGSVEADAGINVDGNITVDGNLTADHGSNDFAITSTNGAVTVEGITFDGNNVTIPGNLTVEGEQTAASNAELVVSASTITVASGSTDSATLDGSGLNFGDNGTTANIRYVHSGTSISMSVDIVAPSAVFDGGVAVDNITIDGTEIDLSSGDLTIDVAGDIVMDSDDGQFRFSDAGAPLATINANVISGSHAADLQVGGNVSASNALFTGTSKFGGLVDIDGTIDIDNDTINIDTSGAGAIDFGAASTIVTAAGDLSLEAEANNAKVVIKGDHESGTAIHLDGNAAAASVIDIDAGNLEIDATTSVFVNSGVHANISGSITQISGSHALELFGAKNVTIHSPIDTYLSGSYTAISGSTGVTIDSDADIELKATGDINVPADVGITFGDDGEKIEGDGTDLTISGAKINLAAGTDVHIPKNKGIVFDDNGSEKIESNDTDLTINSGADINLTATGDVNIPAQIGLTFGADTEKIEVDGSNNMSIIANGDITLDAGGNNVLPGSDNADDLGAADTRWRNVFTTDMHFSNVGTDGNDVDGTTGNWTLQEGDTNIYMINNITGKKYKIGLIEVE